MYWLLYNNNYKVNQKNKTMIKNPNSKISPLRVAIRKAFKVPFSRKIMFCNKIEKGKQN